MKSRNYLLLLVDRKKAELFSLKDGKVGQKKMFVSDQVPQNVKHGDNTWDAPDKIFRHIEDHLQRHLQHTAQTVTTFAKEHPIDGIIIGSHRALFSKIEKQLHYPYNKKIKGRFVTELKAPFKEVLKRAFKVITKVEKLEARPFERSTYDMSQV